MSDELIIPPPSTAPIVESRRRTERQTPLSTIEALQTACSAKDIRQFQAIFNDWLPLGINIRDLNDVLWQAVGEDVAEIVSTFLSHGKPISFMYARAAVHSRSYHVLELFLQHGWDINEPDDITKPTVLGYAVKDEEMARWLLDHGADPNKQCEIDLTPLSCAVEDASWSTIQLFFERGADVHRGEPLHHAINRKTEVVEVLELLLERGAPLNGKQYENHYNSWRLYFFMGLGTALHQAAQVGNVLAVKYLLERGADPNIKDATNRTPLGWAVELKRPEVVALLEEALRGKDI
ncbi:putative hspc200 [Aspergillus karnatakaensis]|uniref:ankyrin repeat domain-containing protein n=1 Tax=Aspergillus karnatakaensis TaxID=1810916 RepID=UPI003CCCE53E